MLTYSTKLLITSVSYNYFMMIKNIFSENVTALYDARFIGDQFLCECYDSFGAIVHQAKSKSNKKNSTPLPYLEEYYNVDTFFSMNADVKTNGLSRIFNATIDALNEEHLPRFLVIVIDKDILQDLKNIEFGVVKSISTMVHWLTRQIDIAVHRKKIPVVRAETRCSHSTQLPSYYLRRYDQKNPNAIWIENCRIS